MLISELLALFQQSPAGLRVVVNGYGGLRWPVTTANLPDLGRN